MPTTDQGSVALWKRSDWAASAVLAGVPGVLLTVAAATGYPLITGDDVTQNFPLEELSGQILSHGHLPLFDSFLWSGAPLLGGTVAHALLPITLLFAVLPPLAAWVVGEILVLAMATIGLQLFLRRTGCSTVPAALAGVSFGIGGFLSSQLEHIDFAAAAAALPWALVALEGLARRPDESRPRHCLLLAGAAAWICLCGSPDIVIDAAVACGAYLVHLLLQPPEEGRRLTPRLRLVAWTVVGTTAGLGIGALQWLPSADFVAASQRAHPSYAFISGGSLTPANLLEALLVPHVRGGGLLGMRPFAGSFPLAEVNAYPGVLALVAVFVLLVRWREPSAWRWRVWLVVLAVSLLLVFGDHTPLEHLVAHLPVAGDQRLPSRALIGVALSSSLLAGYFLDSLLVAHPSRRQVVAGLLPLVAILGVVLATVVAGRPAGGALLTPAAHWALAGVAPYLAISAAVALAAGALLVFGGRLQGRRRLLLVAGLVVVDLLVFDLNQSSLAPAHASSLSPADSAAVAALAGDGRYLVVDPSLGSGSALATVGAPDTGVAAALPDAGGYGSLTWEPYAAATGTHVQDAVDDDAVADGTLADLGVRALLALPSEIVHEGSSTPLGDALRRGGWKPSGSLDGFSVFTETAAPPFEVDAGGSPVTGAVVDVIGSDPWTGAVSVSVRTPRAGSLVRATADVPGWRAVVRHAGAAASVPVTRDGLLQAVAVPAGTSTVTFAYVAPGWQAAQYLALAGAVACAAMLLVPLGRRRLRPGRSPRP